MSATTASYEWWRGRDNHGRLHPFAVGEKDVVHYFPDEPGRVFG
jgi:hypothetical protein